MSTSYNKSYKTWRVMFGHSKVYFYFKFATVDKSAHFKPPHFIAKRWRQGLVTFLKTDMDLNNYCMKFRLLLLAALLTTTQLTQVFSQEMKFAGTHPPNKEVIRLLERESEIFEKVRDVKMRDSLRQQITSKGFFYHGMDGKPISLDGLTKRQTKNEFQSLESKLLSETLYQYETTAILVIMEWQKVRDKGEIHENFNSVLIVMGLENGEWKIQADIIGKNPKLSEEEKKLLNK
jgi:hypothetical protein